jgi:hypothetical protein
MAEYTGELLDVPPKPARSAPPSTPAAEASAVATPTITDSTGFDAEFEKNRKRMQEQHQKDKTEQIQAAPLIQNTDWWLSPPALVGAGALGGAALMYGGSKAIPIVKRWLSSGQNAPQGFVPSNVDVDPALGNLNNLNAPAATPVTTPAATITPGATPAGEFEPPMSRTAAPSQNLTLQEIVTRAQQETPKPSSTPNSTATQAVADTVSNLIATEGAPVTGAAFAPEGIKAAWVPPTSEVINKPSMLPSGSTIGTTPARPVTPTPPAALASTATPITPAPVPPTAVLPKRVQTAITGVPKTVQEQYAKEGKVVLKGYGVGDRSLTNTYGIPAYQKIIDYFNEGKPIGDDANYQIIRKKINQGVPASLAAEFAAKLPGSEAEAGNFGKAFGETGAYTKEGKVVTSPAAMKKAVAGGGALFLATAFPNIVNAGQAASQGKYGEAAGQALDVASGFIPPVAQFLTHIGNAGESPEEQARFERQRDYALKAGRGVAQGYDPRRLIGVAPPTR